MLRATTGIILNPHSYTMSGVITPLYREGQEDSERESDFPEITQLMGNPAGTSTQDQLHNLWAQCRAPYADVKTDTAGH